MIRLFLAFITTLIAFCYLQSALGDTIDVRLLTTFCGSADIRGSTCVNAKDYQYGRRCPVKLGANRYSGKFLSSNRSLLIVDYESDCEPHSNSFGGSVLFEKASDGYIFRGYQRGFRVSGCLSIPRTTKQDRLVCQSGGMGQGHMESTVVEVVFTQDAGKKTNLNFDTLVSAEDSTGAYGVNAVDCKATAEYFEISKIGVGPQSDTLSLEIRYADIATIRQACRSGSPTPSGALGTPPAGFAFISPAVERTSRFIFDLRSRELTPENEFKKRIDDAAAPSGNPANSTPKIALGKLGRRVALVIGNSAYANVATLGNPARDADAMAGAFRKLGFSDVTEVKDVRKSDFQKALLDFADKSVDADWAVIYYAGHGMEIDGINYMVPVDAVLKRDQGVKLETVSLDEMMDAAAAAKRLRIVILDACRDNPFLAKMTRTLATRSIGAGLASVEPQQGTLVAFAAKHGQTAEDGSGADSPFVSAMLEHIGEPGVDVNIFFRKVRDSVLNATANRQEPFVYGSLPGETLSFQPTN
jgi:Caspase domain